MRDVNILVIDDDIVTLELVGLVLEEFTTGQVHTHQISSEAIHTLNKSTSGYYGLVICDLLMPDVDGIDVLTALRESNQDTKFVMLTGTATRDKVLAAKKLGANAFVTKPFTTADLLDKLDQVLA